MGERSAARAATFASGVAASRTSAQRGELGDLNDRIDRLLLVVDAMWDLLKQQGLNDEQLIARILELDEADGTIDGKRTPVPHRCARCQSMISPERSTCAFCGAPAPTEAGPLSSV